MNEPPNPTPNPPGDSSVPPTGEPAAAPTSIETALRVLQAFISNSSSTQTKGVVPPGAPVPNEQVLINVELLRWILRRALAGYMDTSQLSMAAPPLPAPPPTPAAPSPKPPPIPTPAAANPAPNESASPNSLAADYHTAYFIHLQGSFRPRGQHALIINHSIRIELKLVQFLMLLSMACHARCEAGLDAPIEVRGGVYLQPERIVQFIQDLKRRESGLKGQAEHIGLPDIHQARWGVRQRLKKERLNEELLESQQRSGYRLSTPPERIRITLFNEDGNETWS